MAVSVPVPKLITLDVVARCGGRCRYCHWWRQCGPEPTTAALLDRVEAAADLGAKVVRISGGEPMLRNDISRLVRAIRQRGMMGMVCTSGSHGAAPLISLVGSGLEILAISIDTLDPDLFLAIRGYPLDPVLSAIREVAARRDREPFEIIVSSVLTRPSISGLKHLAGFCRELDLLWSVSPVQGDCRESGDLSCREEDLSEIRRALDGLCRLAGKGLRIINSDAYLAACADYLVGQRLPAGYVCRAGDRQAIVTAEGGLKLCHGMAPLTGGTVADLWRSRRAGWMRGKMAEGKCQGCWLSCHADSRREVPAKLGWEAFRWAL